MSENQPSDVLGGLPRTRPHRRSAKRAAPAPPSPAEVPAAVRTKATARKPAARKPAARKPAARKPPARKPPAPKGTGAPVARRGTPASHKPPAAPPRRRPAREPVAAPRSDVIGTAVQAAAELAEIGLHVGARAVQGMIRRLPRP